MERKQYNSGLRHNKGIIASLPRLTDLVPGYLKIEIKGQIECLSNCKTRTVFNS